MINTIWIDNLKQIHWRGIFDKGRKAYSRLLSAITLYHGPQQGYLLGFFISYTNMMFFLMIAGIVALISLLAGEEIDQFLLLTGPYIVGIWSTILLIRWKLQEKDLSYTFNINEEAQKQELRKAYDAPFTINRTIYTIERKKINQKMRYYLVRFFLKIF
jgi:hypothetical protein